MCNVLTRRERPPESTVRPHSSVLHRAPPRPSCLSSRARHFTTAGGVGGALSLWMQDDRSKSMNSSAFSCAERSPVLHDCGNGLFPGVFADALTWKSLNTTRPHCIGSGTSVGVLKVMCIVAFGSVVGMSATVIHVVEGGSGAEFEIVARLEQAELTERRRRVHVDEPLRKRCALGEGLVDGGDLRDGGAVLVGLLGRPHAGRGERRGAEVEPRVAVVRREHAAADGGVVDEVLVGGGGLVVLVALAGEEHDVVVLQLGGVVVERARGGRGGAEVDAVLLVEVDAPVRRCRGVNSVRSMPILVSRHSNGSALPEARAICGRSPSALFRGRRESVASSGVSAHSATLATVICRRHLPTWMTSGMFLPTGTLSSLNLPAASVIALTSGSPETLPHRSHEAPVTMGATGALGT